MVSPFSAAPGCWVSTLGDQIESFSLIFFSLPSIRLVSSFFFLSAEGMPFTNNSAQVSPQIVQDQIYLIHENQARIQFQTKLNWIRIARFRSLKDTIIGFKEIDPLRTETRTVLIN
ncbi:hypothetical protein MUK42_27341 [Musa troglodytarum]|uniref:Uncharacterized protein n=1 Tax=Musa troglodytarum TaxID=320322 RepID=A0A9E7FKT8_9LILI|nr:hypothetical protein MUK42_27341 [Musa troglodytarum]